jgi:hypothetical protein
VREKAHQPPVVQRVEGPLNTLPIPTTSRVIRNG